MKPYTKAQRAAMAQAIADAMRVAYEAEGEEGDFDDAARYYRDDAPYQELREAFAQWVPMGLGFKE